MDLVVANSVDETVSVLKNLSAVLVTNLNSSGVGSLCAALDTSNARLGGNTITFSVAGTIQLTTPLPALSDVIGGTRILGFSAPGASAPFTPTVTLDGSSSGPGPAIIVSSSNNRIEGLTIQHVNGPGVAVIGASSVANSITGCRFSANAGPEIDLGNDGITLNDPSDADTGPNTLLNYPVFDSVSDLSANQFAVYGTAAPGSRVELYLAAEAGNPSYPAESTTHGPAYRLLDWTTAAPAGFFSFAPVSKPLKSLVTATATDVAGNTSEFAENKVLTPDPLRITGYSELLPAMNLKAMRPSGSPSLRLVVYGPPDTLGDVDSISAFFNTFGTRAYYDSLTDFNSSGIPDGRVVIASPDTGEYRAVYILIGEAGKYLTGVGIDAHTEVQREIAFAAVGGVVDTSFRYALFYRGELNGDDVVDVFDVIASIDMIFSGAPMPDPPERVDVNCDGVPDVFDVIYLIDYAFSGGAAPCQ
jgi:hypothetical protein